MEECRYCGSPIHDDDFCCPVCQGLWSLRDSLIPEEPYPDDDEREVLMILLRKEGFHVIL